MSGHILRPRITYPQQPEYVEAQVRGVTITGVRRRGKQVLIDTAQDRTIRVHLGMTGNLYLIDDYRFRPLTARAWFQLEDGRALIFDDPRVLGHLQVHNRAELAEALGHLGMEATSVEFTPELLRQLARASRQPVKLFLMDQAKLAGLGNIYAAEALFLAGIHPSRAAGRLRPARISRLHAAIVQVLEDAIQSACTAYMRPGRFQEAEAFRVQVYGRDGEPCPGCGRKVRRMKQGGRSTYYCPGCQT